MAAAAVKAGYDVALLTHVQSDREVIEAAGIRIIPLDLQRRSLNPFRELKTLLAIINVYKREKPDIVHQVAMKPVLYGSFAARLVGCTRVVNALAGLGFVFSSNQVKARILRPLVAIALRLFLSWKGSRLILQNSDDLKLFVSSGFITAERIELIRGSGVDIISYRPSLFSENVPLVLLATRMLWDKGVLEFAEAVELLHKRKVKARFVLVGDSDEQNPAAISLQQIEEWQDKYGIEFWGRRTDMPQVFTQTHIVCLPSYREGLPKVLLEAAACGRPIVATDVPGCREIVRHNENGLLVPPKNAVALADALQLLIESPDMLAQMGARGRKIVEQEFAQELIIEQTLALYRSILEKP